MRVLVVFAHPLENSYTAALSQVVVDTLKAGGHTVDFCDLYREGFNPVMSASQRSAYRDTATNLDEVAEHVRRLEQADGVVFVFPSWWYGVPAILKGYLDRVWLPGVAFEFGPVAIRPLLRLRLFGVVTTAGDREWLTRLYMGNPSRKVLMRGIARVVGTHGAERFWLALYGMDHATPANRLAFIERVRGRLARIRV